MTTVEVTVSIVRICFNFHFPRVKQDDSIRCREEPRTLKELR